MRIRTDLAVEQKNFGNNFNFKKIKEKENGKVKYIELSATPDDNNKEKTSKICKDEKKYISLEFSNILNLSDYEDIKNSIKEALSSLINKRENILVVGLGNPEIISDSIGPFTAKKILATRHIAENFKINLGLEGIKSVAVITPDVLGNTGVEAVETVKGICERIKPDAVIVIDALAAGSINRLFKAIQITNNGISPGSGVKNERKAINKQTIGAPVVAIGVPTVVDAKSLAYELTKKEALNDTDLIVTPKEVDILCHKITEIIAEALNLFLQPEIDEEVILSLV